LSETPKVKKLPTPSCQNFENLTQLCKFTNFFDFGFQYVIGRQFIKHFLPMISNNSNVYLDSFKLDIVESFLFTTKNCDEESILCRASL